MTSQTEKRAYHQPGIESTPLKRLDDRTAGQLDKLAGRFLDQSDAERAVAALAQAVVLDPLPGERWLLLATALYQNGLFESALAWLDGLTRRPELPAEQHAQADLLRGRILTDLPDPGAAVIAFDRAIQLTPDLLEPRLRKASVLLATGRPAAAISDLDEVLGRHPDNIWARTLRATVRMEIGRPQAGLADLQSIASPDRTVEHHLLTARAQVLAGIPDTEIDAVFESALQQFPDHPGLRLAYCRHLARRRGSDYRAGQAARQRLEALIDPARDLPIQIEAQAVFLLADLVAEQESGSERAENLYQRGLMLEPDDPAGLDGLANLLLQRAQPAQALPWLVHALLIDPERLQTQDLFARALGAIGDDHAVARWLGLVMSGLPTEAPMLMANLLRSAQAAGRSRAYEDVRRQAHRMKNLVAVLAARAGDAAGGEWIREIGRLYEEWSRFLTGIRKLPSQQQLLSPLRWLRRAVEQATPDPDRVRFSLQTELPPIRGDEDQLVDALANVLLNALEASPAGAKPRLSVHCPPGDRWLEVSVTDDGPGIVPEDLPRIFEPGYSRKSSGSGMGLTVAQNAIHSHGGQIAVDSPSGGPTTFSLRLPVATAACTQAWAPIQTLALEKLGSRRPVSTHSQEVPHGGTGDGDR